MSQNTEQSTPLYYFDSSDDEEDINGNQYSKEKSEEIPPYLEPLYILTKMGQAILEQDVVKIEYQKLKTKLYEYLRQNDSSKAILDDAKFYNKQNKFIGKIILDGNYDQELKLSSDAKEFLNNFKTAFKENESKALDIDPRKYQEQWNIVCKEQCARLVNISSAKNENVEKFTKFILKESDTNKSLSEVLQEKNRDLNFKHYSDILKSLNNKTVRYFIQDAKRVLRLELIKKSYTKYSKPNRVDDSDQEGSITYKSKSEKSTNKHETKPWQLEQYKKFMQEFFRPDYIELCIQKDVYGKEYLDEKIFSYFVSYILDNKDNINVAEHNILARHFSQQNKLLLPDLEAYMLQLPLFQGGAASFANFKLAHRIIKAQLKTCSILGESKEFLNIRTIAKTNIATLDKIQLIDTGTRKDYVFLEPDKMEGSYAKVAEQLSSTKYKDINSSLKRILQSKTSGSVLAQGLYLYKLADLLFNIEGERNVSAFLTNIMFFDLVGQGIYNVGDLATRLPMAMQGAIQASRYTLDNLGGKYGTKSSKYLTKRQYFDYKSTSSLSQVEKDGEKKEIQEALKERLLHYELALKNFQIFHDWLNKKSDSSNVEHLIQLLTMVNTIYDKNTKYFHNMDIGNIDAKNDICIKELEKYLPALGIQGDMHGEIRVDSGEQKMQIESQKSDNINNDIRNNIDNICIDDCSGALNTIKKLISKHQQKKLADSYLSKSTISIIPRLKKAKKTDDSDIPNSEDAVMPNSTNTILKFVRNYVESSIKNKIPRKLIGSTKIYEDLSILIKEWYGLEISLDNFESFIRNSARVNSLIKNKMEELGLVSIEKEKVYGEDSLIIESMQNEVIKEIKVGSTPYYCIFNGKNYIEANITNFIELIPNHINRIKVHENTVNINNKANLEEFLEAGEECNQWIKKLWTDQNFSLPQNNNLEESIISNQAKSVQGFYSDNDVMLLIQALLRQSGYKRNDDPKAFGLIDGTATYIFNTTSLEDGEYRLTDLARDVCKILLTNVGQAKNILIPVRLRSEYHWVTAQLKIDINSKITAYIHDSLYSNKCIQDDIILGLSNLFQQKEQLMKILRQKDGVTITFEEQEIQQLEPYLNSFKITASIATKIQNKTSNVYCGGYTARIISKLVQEDVTETNKDTIWHCGENNDNQLRKEDAIIVNKSGIHNPHLFGARQLTGDWQETASRAEKIRSYQTNHILERIKKELPSEKTSEIFSALNEVVGASFDNINILAETEDLLTPDELYPKLRSIQPNLHKNHPLIKYLFQWDDQGNLKVDEGQFIIDSYYQPNQLLFLLVETKKCLANRIEEVRGINGLNAGLSCDSINFNLDNIIKFNDRPNLYIQNKIVDGQYIHNEVMNWSMKNSKFDQYASIIKVENSVGKKHAILLYANQKNNGIYITLIDPLSQDDSEFTAQINELKIALSNQELCQVQIIYAGSQNKDSGTCGDMTLILLKELTEQSSHKLITKTNDRVMPDNISSEQIKHVLEHDNSNLDLLGCHDLIE